MQLNVDNPVALKSEKIINNRLLCTAALTSGAAIATSTALQNIGATLLVFGVLFTPGILVLLKNEIQKPFSIVGLTIGVALLLGAIGTSAASGDAVDFLIKMRAYYLIPFFLVALHNKTARNIFLAGFAAATLLSVVLSILAAWFNYPIFHAIPGDWFIFRTHTYHNFFAAILATGILASLLTNSTARWPRWLLWILFGLISYDIFFLVAGRTGQLVYLVMLTAILLHWKLRVGIAVCTLLVLSVSLLFPILSPVLTKGLADARSDLADYRQGQANTSIGLRLTWHQHSLELIQEKPLIGHGTGSFKTEYARISGAANTPMMSENPHNDYLWLAVELGVFGGLLLVALLLAAAWQGRHLEPAWKSTLYALLLGMGVSTLANSFFTDNISGLAFVLLTCAMLNGPRTEHSTSA